jgi:hypothetical protein
MTASKICSRTTYADVATSAEIAKAISPAQKATRLTVPAFSAGFAEPPGM